MPGFSSQRSSEHASFPTDNSYEGRIGSQWHEYREHYDHSDDSENELSSDEGRLVHPNWGYSDDEETDEENVETSGTYYDNESMDDSSELEDDNTAEKYAEEEEGDESGYDVESEDNGDSESWDSDSEADECNTDHNDHHDGKYR